MPSSLPGKLGVYALAAVAALGAAEAYLRLRTTSIVSQGGAILEHDSGLLVRDTSKGKRLVPNAHVVIRNHYLSKKDVRMDVNSLGFRDAELPAQKAEGGLRVLALGDSITWADYVQADEAWVEKAERRLAEDLPGREVEVVNAGVGDIGLKEELDILEETGLGTLPDVVLVGFYLNDSRPPWGFPAEAGRPGWLRRHSLLVDSLYRAAKLRGFVRRQGEERLGWIRQLKKIPWRESREGFDRLAGLARYDWGAVWTEEAWQVLGRELDRLQALAAQHRFAVAVVAFPVSFQVYAPFLADEPQQRMAKEAARRGFAFHDLLPLLRLRSNEDLFFDQCHPREKTNELIGNEVAAFLRETYGWR